MESVTYMNVDDVCFLLTPESTDKDFCIIDVRDIDEWADGHIIGALHQPSEEWRSREYVKKIAETHQHHKSIIVHCFKSQQRGPTCARVLATQYEIIQAENKDKPDFRVPSIKVMRGGFCEFDRRYRNDSKLIEKGW